jgi:DNA-binding transcriptional ArsR family regulator
MDQDQIAGLERLFLALADKTRLRLLSLMANGEVSVGYLSAALGESQPKTSRHLAYLRNAGLVDTRRDGKWIYYYLRSDGSDTARGVLNAVLYGNTVSEEHVRYDGSVSGESFNDTSAEVHMSEFYPNEMDIFLL